MKKIFKADRALKIVTVNPKTNKKIELIYTIVDTDIADRWINLININNERKNTLRYNYRKFLNVNFSFYSIWYFRNANNHIPYQIGLFYGIIFSFFHQ
jgi:hypothetical protein